MGTDAANTTKLKAFSIWAIGVGMVISGESFGWNIGWGITGPVAFFIPVAFTAVMYYALVQCLIELACVYPSAAGPQEYVAHAFGKNWGSIISLAVLFEFLFATPAIANSIGEYIGFLNNKPESSRWIATVFIASFSAVNVFNVNIGVRFLLALTLLAIIELLLYNTSIAGHFSLGNLQYQPYSNTSISSLTKALPFAIWLLLAIEGISLLTKDVERKHFRKHITIGYQSAFWTLLLIALCVLLFAAGSIRWNAENWRVMSSDNHPMPASLAIILGKDNAVVHVFTFIGLFGLIASLQGVALAATAQLEQFLPVALQTGKRKRILSSLLVFAVSATAIWSSSAALLIELSVFGAVAMYLGISTALLRMRMDLATPPLPPADETSYNHAHFSKTKSLVFAVVTALFSLFCLVSLSITSHKTFVVFVVICVLFFAGVVIKKQRLAKNA